MEQLGKHSRLLASGGLVLLWVLGAGTAAHAEPPVLDIFQGSFCLGEAPAKGDSLQLLFVAVDQSEPGTFTFRTDPVSLCQTGPISFTGELCATCEPVGDTWQLHLESGTLTHCGDEQTFDCCGSFTPGTFQYIQGANGVESMTNIQDFSFTEFDPLVVTNGQFATPAVAGAPEIDTASGAAPLAAAVGTLLMLSGARRKKTADEA